MSTQPSPAGLSGIKHDRLTFRDYLSIPAVRRTVSAIFCPLSCALIFYKIFIEAVNGYITDDFRPVYSAIMRFLQHAPIYVENYNFTNPHYLYSPSATLLLSPFGLLGSPETCRLVFIIFNALCIVAATGVLVKVFGEPLNSPLFPLLLFVTFLTEAVSNTLIFSNINGFIYLCEVLFFRLLLTDRPGWAGIPLGLSIAIKPMLAPLLLIPLLQRRISPLIGSILIPVVLNLIAWPLSADAGDYFRRTTPYLGEVRDYYNNAIAGWLAYWGAPSAAIWVVRIAVILLGFATIALLFRYRNSQPMLWMLTTSGVILLISFLGGSLGQRYYSTMLIPMVATVIFRESWVRSWWAWLAVFLILDNTRWYSHRWYMYGRWIEYSRGTIGWLLLLIVIFVVTVWRISVAKKNADCLNYDELTATNQQV